MLVVLVRADVVLDRAAGVTLRRAEVLGVVRVPLTVMFSEETFALEEDSRA
jgi:hypothetical protein